MNAATKILKHSLSTERVQILDLPRGARTLGADIQPTHDGGRIVLWSLVAEGQPIVRRRVALVQTGDALDPEVVERYEHVAIMQALVPCRRPDGTVTTRAVVEHVWVEREVAVAN